MGGQLGSEENQGFLDWTWTATSYGDQLSSSHPIRLGGPHVGGNTKVRSPFLDDTIWFHRIKHRVIVFNLYHPDNLKVFKTPDRAL